MSLLENQRLAARVSNSHHNSKKSPASTSATSRPGVHGGPPKVVNAVKQKAQQLKELRDYSFLSKDEELSARSKEPPPRNVSVANSAHASSKSQKPVSSSSRQVSNGREQRTHVSMSHQMQSKAGQYKVALGSRPNSNSSNPRKQLGSSAANGPAGRRIGTKSLPSKLPVPTKTPTSNKITISNKVPTSTMDKKASVVGVRRPLPGVQRAPLPIPHSSVTGVRRTTLPKTHSSGPGVQKAPLSKLHPSERRREIREPDRGRLMSKLPVSSSRPQTKPPKQNPSRAPAPMQIVRPKKRPTRLLANKDEDGNAISSMIRNMFRYDPNKYDNDEDDSDMEAGFDDILKEEKYSAKVAREEDERELRLIEEEERRERMRKQAKRRKLR